MLDENSFGQTNPVLNRKGLCMTSKNKVPASATPVAKKRRAAAKKTDAGQALIQPKTEMRRKRYVQPNRSSQVIRWVFFVLILAVVALLAGAVIGEIRKNAALSSAQANAGQLQWQSEPAMVIDPAKSYFATLDTSQGKIRIQLFADKAPHAVNNFVFLARAGFYEGTTFHRVLKDFMAQGGDPTGTGMGGPGYSFADEIVPGLTFAEPGVVAMANSGKNTNGSQFFITFAPQPSLDGGYTIFGKVVDGMPVVLSLKKRDPNQNPSFLGDVIQSVTIEETTSAMADVVSYAAPLASPEPQSGRPLAALAMARREDLFRIPPAMSIDQSHSYQATVTTTKGKIVVDLFNADAPRSVNNFVVLANLGYWDHYPVSRLLPGKWVLSGAPADAAGKDVGYSLPSEIKRPNEAGAFGYWSSPEGSGSSGSAIYILLQDNKTMDAAFTVFGKVTEGLDVASTLSLSDSIESIVIEEK
jgi:cyclophilin family peptidyl-prolyl cis-trans isomerase